MRDFLVTEEQMREHCRGLIRDANPDAITAQQVRQSFASEASGHWHDQLETIWRQELRTHRGEPEPVESPELVQSPEETTPTPDA